MSLVLPHQRTRPSELDPEERLFRHRARPDWGVGVWVREEASRRRLRFEDGQMRAFKKGFYAMLVPVDPDRVDVDEVFERVMDEHHDASALATDVEPPVMPFAAQVDLFLHLFPGGFRGDAYRAAWGSEAKASRQLAARSEALREALRDPGTAPADASERFVAALEGLAPIGATSLRALAALDAAGHEALGQAVLTLVHGEHRFSRRFQAWLDALAAVGVTPRWRLATAPLALWQPNKHVLVRRQVLDLQARSIHPAKIPSRPSLAGYRRARRTARGVRDKLIALGLAPGSLLDVHAFVWETLRPKAQRLAAER